MEEHDLEYAKNLISFIEAEETSERELKLEILEKWFETKFADLAPTRDGGMLCERFVQIANPKALLKVAFNSMESMENLMTNTFASYAVKKLITNIMIHLQSQSLQLSMAKKLKSWVESFCEFCSEHLEEITNNDISLLVLKHTIQLLGGINNPKLYSKTGKKRKRGEVEEKQKPIKLPKELKEPFLALIKRTVALATNLEEWLQNPSTGTLLTTLVEVLHKKDKKEFEKVCKNFEVVFNPEESLWSSAQGSFLAEKIWSLSSEEYQQHVFETYLKSKFVEMCSTEKSNKAINVIIHDTKSSSLFKTICKMMCSSVESIVSSGNGYFLVSLANGCLQHVKCQKKFLTAIKEHLQCESKPKLLFPTIIYFMKAKQYETNPEDLQTSYFGTRILQALLKFETNTLVIESLQQLKTEQCLQLICDSKAVYTFEAFLKSETIDMKIIKGIFNKWIPSINQFVAHKIGSRIFDVIWEKCDLETKESILEILVSNEATLNKIPTFKFTKLKCKQNEFKYNKNKWTSLITKKK